MPPESPSSLVIAPVTPEFTGWTGGGTYLKHLLGLLASARADGADTPWVALYADDRSSELFGDLIQSTIVAFTVGSDRTIRDLRPNFIEACGTNSKSPDQQKLMHVVSQHLSRAVSFPITYPHYPANVPRPVYWIPDFQHKALPHFFPPQELDARDRKFGEIAADSVDLLLSSQAALNDFRHYYPAAASRCHKWSFVSLLDQSADNGTPVETVRDKYGLPIRFFYIANQVWAHKDHLTAFRALRSVRENGLPVELVCTGAAHDYRDPAYSQALEQAVADAGLSAHIRMLGMIPRQDQIGIFRAATAILQPSQFEGWSTVVEDARTLGRPVLLSDLPVHREQMPDNPYFFRTGDSQDLARLMVTAWADLPDGPDPENEKRAAAAMVERRRQAAQAFTDIVRTVSRS